MTWQEFTALLALATAMSFTPGPNTALSTALAANHGLPRALRFVCAVPVGWAALLTLCSAGLGALLLAAPALRLGVKLAGVAYLFWLAWRLGRSAQLAQADARRLTVGFWQGVLLQFLNIKAWMLALAIVSGWIAGQPDAGRRLVTVLPVLLTFAFASNLAYALAGALLRAWLAQGRRLLWFNRAMALILLLTGGWMATL